MARIGTTRSSVAATDSTGMNGDGSGAGVWARSWYCTSADSGGHPRDGRCHRRRVQSGEEHVGVQMEGKTCEETQSLDRMVSYHGYGRSDGGAG